MTSNIQVTSERFCGHVIDQDYANAVVITSDNWKLRVNGFPQHTLLLATNDPPGPIKTFALLLQVLGPADTPDTKDNLQVKLDRLSRLRSVGEPITYDPITAAQIQTGALRCRTIGTFYRNNDSDLVLSRDVENFTTGDALSVYKPDGETLEAIVNHRNPANMLAAGQAATKLGLDVEKVFELGTVSTSATDYLFRSGSETPSKYYLRSVDIIKNRTFLAGMTRTGKSNAAKVLVRAVRDFGQSSAVPMANFILDPSGEFANPNPQGNSISDVFPEDDIKKYSLSPKVGFRPLQTNFYAQIQEGLDTIRSLIPVSSINSSDVKTLLQSDLEQPPGDAPRNEYIRWQRWVAAYQCCLSAAGFEPPNSTRVYFTANAEVRSAVEAAAGRAFPDPRIGLDINTATNWFENAREANITAKLRSSSKRDWVDDLLGALLNILVRKSSKNGFINGFRELRVALPYHSPARDQVVLDEIYGYLRQGKIVIVDVSLGPEGLREPLSKRIAAKIMNESKLLFTDNKVPPFINIYIDEAHNMIGKHVPDTDPWPLIAKEGAKYNIGLVYATQEVTSIPMSIRAATENWIVFHLNNSHEIDALAGYYDFGYYKNQILDVSDVGLARVKTLSNSYTVQVQIAPF